MWILTDLSDFVRPGAQMAQKTSRVDSPTSSSVVFAAPPSIDVDHESLLSPPSLLSVPASSSVRYAYLRLGRLFTAARAIGLKRELNYVVESRAVPSDMDPLLPYTPTQPA
ncbi:hypothetical protein SCP_0904700 [Sparassis crispa]|uniref:Uncharacterized protein n=1 Tax=Sparassis crispa TaxID=139825 RepID=A0A401GWK1_9APHY|nr:hypothetical protein SCP_0904700 [Sparassis crispa]GBE86591.1 hypothetical protein SCP_0904700 [Sparassis crispa]